MYWGWITKSVLIGALATFTLAFGLWLFFIQTNAAETKVVFLSVGQGDAILISQGMNQIVIDGGRDGRLLLSRLGRHVPFYDRTIEVLIPTHPDADHIGGLSALLERYRVKTVLDTGARTDTRSAFLFYRDLEQEGADRVPALRGTSVTLPGGGALSVVYPYAPEPADVPETNEGSVVARFEYGETSFLFTGDLPDEERFIPDLTPVDVLKAGHHGSRYSTSDALLDLVRPEAAIISVGKNTYGHPHPAVLERLQTHGVNVSRTDMEGDIVYRCRENACQRER
ncbi:MAG: MBL fold metallo-hydrolase [Candidatus Moraniibacteriota bacterium]|nr:MAG: MBL fold metallo-hydrolase [Candidatus Moranbacteria bacterium]